MRSQDIEIGTEYAIADRYNWDRHRVMRGKITGVTAEKGVRYGTSVTTVRGVDVATGRPFSVRPADVRGPWSTVGVEADARREAADIAARAKLQARDAGLQRADRAIGRVQALGHTRVMRGNTPGWVEIDATALHAILDRLEG